jgi:hypothetical protein
MATGDRYEGEWADGKKNGAGKPFLTQAFIFSQMEMFMTDTSLVAIAKVPVSIHGSTRAIITENGMLTV